MAQNPDPFHFETTLRKKQYAWYTMLRWSHENAGMTRTPGYPT